MHIVNLPTLCCLLLSALSFTLVNHAHAEVETELQIEQYQNRLAISSTTQVQNWYLKSFNRHEQATVKPELNPGETWFVNGGYEHQLAQELSLFVEAGLNHQYNDIASQRGYNLSTGINYRPSKHLSLQSKLSQIYQHKQTEPEHGFEVSSSYELIQHVDIKAAYQVELQQQNLQQQLQLGLGYRF